MTTTCAAVTAWPEVPPRGVRLSCCLPAGHDGEHACAEIEYLTESTPTTHGTAPLAAEQGAEVPGERDNAARPYWIDPMGDE